MLIVLVLVVVIRMFLKINFSFFKIYIFKKIIFLIIKSTFGEWMNGSDAALLNDARAIYQHIAFFAFS